MSEANCRVAAQFAKQTSARAKRSDRKGPRVLDISEVETVYGWRVGRYFIENVRAWGRFETEAAVNATCGVIDVQLKNDRSCVPAQFTATCGDETAFQAFSTNPLAWLFRKEWNVMRVVRRGTVVSPEWVSCSVDYEFFCIHLR